MAPSRGKDKGKAMANPVAGRSGPSRRAKRREDASRDVYNELLAEVADQQEPNSIRPLKRRRVMREVSIPKYRDHLKFEDQTTGKQERQSGRSHATTTNQPISENVDDPFQRVQTIDASSDSGESDLGFEDVDLTGRATTAQEPDTDTDDDEIADVSVSVAPTSSSSKKAANRRKPVSAPEKAFRLVVHKAHILMLLGHCMYMNSRCNDVTVHKHMRSLIDKKTRSYLNPKTEYSQFQRNRSFIDGLEMALNAFKLAFQLTASGMRSAVWAADQEPTVPAADTVPADLHEFRLAARDLQGSQDTGNQLLCALLRSAGVETRIVCSLQVLPYANVSAKQNTPQKYKKPAVFAIASDTDPNISDASMSDNNIGSSSKIGSIPSVRRRLGQSGLASTATPKPRPKQRAAPIRKLAYPVFWVEAFNAAHQKWITVDATATETIAKPTKIEPPIAYTLNQLTYAIAFEADGVARDVTRRYAKAFNAKTRRQRVESSEDGTIWLKRALRFLRRRGTKFDRDQVEDAELAQKEAREGLPSNVLDFKDHPYYALERHLRRHEVLNPRREVGKVNAGTAAKPRMEAVFRRQDVLSCKSADKWYRLGREIKVGEQPLKHVPARSTARRAESDEEDVSGKQKLTALYSPQQTQVYIPPPVVDGRVPRNVYGNLDIYTLSMIPAGGVHIPHALAQHAARILQIDYADAVTGFKFQGRHGTAVIEGAVVAEQFSEAMHAVIEGLEYEAVEEESKARSILALRMWARMLKGLRIAERVASYGRGDDADTMRRDMDAEVDEGMDVDVAGGFVIAETEEVAMPTAGKFSLIELAERRKTSEKGKRKSNEPAAESDEVYAPAAGRSSRRRKVVVNDGECEDDIDDGGGGFLAENSEHTMENAGDDDCSGGFMVPATVETVELIGHGEYGGGFMPADEIASEETGGGFTLSDDGGIDERVRDDEACSGFLPDEGALGEETSDKLLVDGEQTSGPEMPGGFVCRALAGTVRDVGMNARGDGEMVDHRSMSEATVEDHHSSRSADKEENLADMTGTFLATASGLQGGPDLHLARDSLPIPQHDQVEDDRGSLLSHDPDDEDAEPDWLESD